MDLNKIEFKGDKKFLSNMFETEIEFKHIPEIKHLFDNKYFDNKLYKSSEHIYMSMKSENKKWHKILQFIDKPTKTKTLASILLVPFNNILVEGQFHIRKDFDNLKYDIMRRIIYLKFLQNKELSDKLINLDGLIEERNCWNDIYWGTCDGIGENNLGKILMEVRDYLKSKRIDYEK
jgi:predicted NAD-dependent protein-ADP-ribosyltransferase YbiA (DUF1768 family)